MSLKLVQSRAIGINTFVRKNHFNLNKESFPGSGQWYAHLYGADKPETKGKEGDFIQQCTGLSTRGLAIHKNGNTSKKVENLRLKCINNLLKKKQSSGEEESFGSGWLTLFTHFKPLGLSKTRVS